MFLIWTTVKKKIMVTLFKIVHFHYRYKEKNIFNAIL